MNESGGEYWNLLDLKPPWNESGAELSPVTGSMYFSFVLMIAPKIGIKLIE
jgi:hypothetical protein